MGKSYLRDDSWDNCLQDGLRNFLQFLFWSIIINNFIVKNNFSEPLKHRILNISRPVYYKKNPAHHFEDHIWTNKLEANFFWKKIFLRSWSIFRDCETTDLGLIFFPKKK